MSRRAAPAPVELVTLATRVPKALVRELRVHCVKVERQVQDFVREACAERLAQKTRGRRARTEAQADQP